MTPRTEKPHKTTRKYKMRAVCNNRSLRPTLLATMLVVLAVLLTALGVFFADAVSTLTRMRRHRSLCEDSMKFLEEGGDARPASSINIVGAFVIHQSHRIDRTPNIAVLESCLRELVSLQVVEADDGSGFDCGSATTTLTRGERGCFSSHLAMFERAYLTPAFQSSPDNWILVFEDDVTVHLPTKTTCRLIITGLEEVPAMTPIVYLGFGDVTIRQTLQVGKHTFVGQAGFGTHAYALRCVHAGKMLALCQREKVRCGHTIDALLHQTIPNAGFVYADGERRRLAATCWGCGLFGQDAASASGVQAAEGVLARIWKAHVERVDRLMAPTAFI